MTLYGLFLEVINQKVTYNICIHVYDYIEIEYHMLDFSSISMRGWLDAIPLQGVLFYHKLFGVATLFDHHNFGTPYILHNLCEKDS